MCQPEDPELLIRPRWCPEPSLTLISRLCADELVNWTLEQSLAGAQRPALSAVLERLRTRWVEAGPSIAAEAHCWSTATSPTRRSGRTSRAGRGGGPYPRRGRALTEEKNTVYCKKIDSGYLIRRGGGCSSESQTKRIDKEGICSVRWFSTGRVDRRERYIT